jgi:amino acid transporter
MHMMEEMPKPEKNGPKLIISAISMAIVTGFCYISAVLFVISDIPAAVRSSEPLLTIYYQATQSKAGSICLMIFPILGFVLCTIDDMATSSRLSYALARDGGMPFNRYFTQVHPNLGVPVAGLLWCSFWDIIFGLIFLGSSNAFNAIISAAVVCVTVTYAIPPTINLFRGRRMLPENRPFKLPNAVGYICNIADLAWTALILVLFVFPTENPTDPVSMNYTIVALGVVFLVAGSNWVLSARKTYQLPTFELSDGSDMSVLEVDQALEQDSNSPKKDSREEKID